MVFHWRADGGPFWLQGIAFLRNTSTDPPPLPLKKIIKVNVKTLDPDYPEETLSAQVYCNEYGKIMRHIRHWK